MDTRRKSKSTSPAALPKLIPMFRAAKILGVSKATVSKLAKRGILNVVRQGRLRRFYESEVRQLKKLGKSIVKTMDLQEEIVALRFKFERVKLLAACIVERLDIPYKPVSFDRRTLNYWAWFKNSRLKVTPRCSAAL